MTLTTIWIAVVLCGVGLAGPAFGQVPPQPESEAEGVQVELAKAYATATVRTSTPVWLGQMVQVEVSLFRDNRNENGAPFFGETHVEGGIAQLSKWAPTPDVETQDTVEYLVHHRIYQVFPQYGAAFEFPAIEVSWFEGGESLSVTSPPMGIPIKPQSGIPDSRWVAASGVTVSQEVVGDLDRIRVGDAVTRIITIQASDTDAMLLPPTHFEPIDGLATYLSEPQLVSSSSRGDFKATRIDKFTYVAQEWGFYELPPVRIAWFDTASGTWAEALAEPVSFRTRVNPDLGANCIGGGERAPYSTWVVLLLALAGLGLWRLVLRFRGRQTVGSLPSVDRHKELVVALKSNDPIATLNAIYRWFGTLDRPPATTAGFRPEDSELQGHLDALNELAVGRPASWDPKTLQTRLDSDSIEAAVSGDLPELNPRSGLADV